MTLDDLERRIQGLPKCQIQELSNVQSYGLQI